MTSFGRLGGFGGDLAAAGIFGQWVERHDIESLSDSKGAYALALRLDETIAIDLPRVAGDRLSPGWYVYVGSAWGSGGLRARLGRHFRPEKRPHWHVDRLTGRSPEMAALVVAAGRECDIAEELLRSHRCEIAAAGFGSSDCRRCESHLLAVRTP